METSKETRKQYVKRTHPVIIGTRLDPDCPTDFRPIIGDMSQFYFMKEQLLIRNLTSLSTKKSVLSNSIFEN